jgi:hypothetical protein
MKAAIVAGVVVGALVRVAGMTVPAWVVIPALALAALADALIGWAGAMRACL